MNNPKNDLKSPAGPEHTDSPVPSGQIERSIDSHFTYDASRSGPPRTTVTFFEYDQALPRPAASSTKSPESYWDFTVR